LKYGDILKHCFTTRRGGVSTGECNSLNLGFKRNDVRDNVIKNFEIISESVGIKPDNLVFSNQVHGTKLVVVDGKDRGKGFTRESDITGVDGLVTVCPEVALVTFYADCVPVFLFDPVSKVAALAHSGWRGTVNEIAAAAVDLMCERFATHPSDIEAAIGPSINRCCFEVGDEVFEEFNSKLDWSKAFFVRNNNGKWQLSLQGVIQRTLMNKGLLNEKIAVSRMCTRCNSDIFFSHRADIGKTGSLAAIMQIV
jgi:YfiH family protein